MNFNDLFNLPMPASGIFYLSDETDLPKLQARFESLKWRVFIVDGREVQNKEQCFNRFDADLSFPDYFGRNWDAFEECMREILWDDKPPKVLICTNFQEFANQHKHDFDILLDITEDLIKENLCYERQREYLLLPLVILFHRTHAASVKLQLLNVGE